VGPSGRRNRAGSRAVLSRMRTVTRWRLWRFDPRLLIVSGLSLILVACNKGGTPGY